MELIGFIGMLEFVLLDVNFNNYPKNKLPLTFTLAMQFYTREIIDITEIPGYYKNSDLLVVDLSKSIETYEDWQEMIKSLDGCPYFHQTTQFDHLSNQNLYSIFKFNSELKNQIEIMHGIFDNYKLYEAIKYIEKLNNVLELIMFVKRIKEYNVRNIDIRGVRRQLKKLKTELGVDTFYSGNISAGDFLPFELLYLEP